MWLKNKEVSKIIIYNYHLITAEIKANERLISKYLCKIKGRPCTDALTLSYVYFISSIYSSVLDGGKRVRFIFNSLLSLKGPHMQTLNGCT